MSEKKNIVESVKTVAILVAICLVCVLLLAICNDLFYISDDVLFERAMKKIYPNFVDDGSPALDNEYKANDTYGEIKELYKSKDGAYVILVSGNGGFHDSDIELYVVITADAKVAGWSVKDYKGNTYTIKDGYNYIGSDVSNEIAFEKYTGATFTSNAATNAINMACYYARNALGLGSNPEKDAKEAVATLLGETVTLTAPIQLDKKVDATRTIADVYSTASDTLSYYFVADGIEAFVYGTDESRKIVVVKADGTVVKTENADEVASAVQSAGKLVPVSFGSYSGYGFVVKGEGDKSHVVYTASGIKIGTVPNTYVLEVTVENGTVSAITVTTSGYVPGDPSQANTDKLATSLVGATSETVDNMYSSNKVGGATQSANLITSAVQAVLSQYAIDFAE